MRRWLFGKQEPLTPPETGKPNRKRYLRAKGVTFGIDDMENAKVPDFTLQVIQDLRDELKELNKQMSALRDDFRIVFGVEDQADDQ